MKKLNGKRILIVGGSSGLGLSAAHAFLNEGAVVLCVGRNSETLERAKQELGAGCQIYCGDASQPETATEAVQLALSVWGGLDGLYHVAGGSGRKWGDGPLDKLSEAGWDYTLDLNLKSVYLSNQAVLQHGLCTGGFPLSNIFFHSRLRCSQISNHWNDTFHCRLLRQIQHSSQRSGPSTRRNSNGSARS